MGYNYYASLVYAYNYYVPWDFFSREQIWNITYVQTIENTCWIVVKLEN